MNMAGRASGGRCLHCATDRCDPATCRCLCHHGRGQVAAGPAAATGVSASGATTVRISEETVVRCGTVPGSRQAWLTLRYVSTAVTVVLDRDQLGMLVDGLIVAYDATGRVS